MLRLKKKKQNKKLIFLITLVHNSPIFTVACLVPTPLNGSVAEGDFVMIKHSCLSNANYFVIKLTRYWSLTLQGHLEPHSKSKAQKLSTQLQNSLLGGLA